MGALTGVSVLAALAAYVVLASALNWPQSLDASGPEALRLLVAERRGLLIGSSLNLVHVLALIPLAVLLPKALGLPSHWLVTVSLVFGVGSAALRAVGVVGGLVVLPSLADDFVAAGPGSAVREAAVRDYSAAFAWTQGVGQVLGFALAAGAWVALVGVALKRAGWAPRLVWFSVLTSLALIGTLALPAALPLAAGAFLVWLVWLNRAFRRAEPSASLSGSDVDKRVEIGSPTSVATAGDPR